MIGEYWAASMFSSRHPRCGKSTGPAFRIGAETALGVNGGRQMSGWRRAVGIPSLVAGSAAVLALLALVLSVVALSRSGGGDPVASGPTGMTPARLQPAETDSPAGSTEDPGTSDPGGGADPTSTTLPSADADYSPSYEDVQVTLRGGSNVDRTLDLDQPLVNADTTTSDATYTDYEGPPTLEFGATGVAVVKSPSANPSECAKDIQLSPANQKITLSQDLVICAITNGAGAVNEPERVKMARIIVKTVADDGTALLSITTWEVPH